MSGKLLGLLSLVLSSSGAFIASGAPIQWSIADGGNGHWYTVVTQPSILFTEAKSAAASMTFMGTSGKLATTDLAGESTFIYNNLTQPAAPSSEVYGFWLGAEAVANSEPWRWVDGELVTSQQTSYPGEQWYVDYFDDGGSGWGLCHFVNSWWTNPIRPQDTARTNPSGIQGYVVEFDVVPEPGTLTLLTLGSLMLLFRRQCK